MFVSNNLKIFAKIATGAQSITNKKINSNLYKISQKNFFPQ